MLLEEKTTIPTVRVSLEYLASLHSGGFDELFAGKGKVIDTIFEKLKSFKPTSRTITG
jgi:hypothetical protein